MKLALRRLGIIVAISGFLFTGAAVDRASAQTSDPFTAANCTDGNYSCLVANGGQLPVEAPTSADFARVGCSQGNFSCYRDKTGYTGP